MDYIWFFGVMALVCGVIYWINRGPARFRTHVLNSAKTSEEFQQALLAATQQQAAALDRIATALENRPR